MRRLLSLLLWGLAFLTISGCATHKVDIKAIEANRNKTFKVGMIKVAGRMPVPGGDNVGKKIEALEKIPVKGINDALGSRYGIRFDTYFDKTVKTVFEKVEGQGSSAPSSATISVKLNMMSENPYCGNKEYKKTGLLKDILPLLAGSAIEDEDVGDNIYITYGYKGGLLFKDIFFYEVIVKSDDIVLVHQVGTVAEIDTPKKGLIIDINGVWNNFVTYADKITEALVRDINK